MRSPFRTSASGPPTADSGEACRTIGPYAVPLLRPADLLVRIREGAPDVAIHPRLLGAEALPKRLTRDRQTVEVEHRRQLAQNGAESAGGVQIRHVVLAGRFQVDEHRRFVAERVQA